MLDRVDTQNTELRIALREGSSLKCPSQFSESRVL